MYSLDPVQSRLVVLRTRVRSNDVRVGRYNIRYAVDGAHDARGWWAGEAGKTAGISTAVRRSVRSCTVLGRRVDRVFVDPPEVADREFSWAMDTRLRVQPSVYSLIWFSIPLC